MATSATSTTSTAVTSASASPLAPSTIFQTSVSTTAAPPIFTTPYAFPRECDTVSWNLTIAKRPSSREAGGASLHETFLWIPHGKYIDYNTAYYQKCFRPPAETFSFDDIELGHQYFTAVYHGAVCPKDWQAFDIGLTSNGRSQMGSTANIWSTAHCCKIGHSLVSDVWYLSYEPGYYLSGSTIRAVCVQTFATDKGEHGGLQDVVTAVPYTTREINRETFSVWTKTITGYYQTNRLFTTQSTSLSTWTVTPNNYDWGWNSTTSTVYWTGGRAYYPPWSVEWVAEDNVTLNPPWPSLTSDMLIPTWTPGMSVVEGFYDNKGKGASSTPPPEQTKLGKIGIPIIGALAGLIGLLLILGLAFGCLRRRRARKNELKRQSLMHEIETRPGEDGTVRSRSGSLIVIPAE